MRCKRVLYTNQLTEQIRTKLKIIKYDKVKSKKQNVYFVYFASEEDAKYASKACKRLQNITIKPFQSKPSTSTIIKETLSSMDKKDPEITTTQKKIKPNSSEVQQLLENIDACVNAMKIIKCTLDQISEIHEKKFKEKKTLINRSYTEYSTALYIKMALAIQLKSAFSNGLRLSWSTIASQVNLFERHVYYEQALVKNMELKPIDCLKQLDFQSSITMSSKLAYELIKLTGK